MSLIDLRPGLNAFLLGDADVSAAVDGARIYPGQMPQGERRQSVVYQEVSSTTDYTNDGPTRLMQPRYQMTAWAPTQDAAVALSLLVKARIDGFRGVFSWGSDSPQQQVTVQGVFFENSRDLYDADAKLFGKSVDYFIWFKEG